MRFLRKIYILIGGQVLISWKYNFCFIHVNKTAGTSFETGNITKYFGRNDIITPHLDTEEEENRRDNLGIRPQNFKARSPFSKKEARHIRNRLLHLYWNDVFPVRFRGHDTAVKVRDEIGQSKFDKLFKFCFTRNPYDKIISLITWRMQNILGAEQRHQRESYFSLSPELVEEYILNGFAKQCFDSSWGMYTDSDDSIIVDKVYKMENLAASLVEIRDRIGFPEDIVLSKSKTYARNRSQPVKSLYTELSRQVVEKVCRKELDHFGYTFENSF
jgi:hypothetical protein